MPPGPRQELRLTEAAHDFLADGPQALEKAAPEHEGKELTGELTLTISPMTSDNAAHQANSPHRGAGLGRAGSHSQHHPDPPVLLLIRIGRESIGPIKLDLASAPPVTVHAPTELLGQVLPGGTHRVPVAELRLDAGSAPAPQLPWEAFPAATDAIADWIIATASEHKDRVVLLAARMPQELAVGLGIRIGQRRQHWPIRMPSPTASSCGIRRRRATVPAASSAIASMRCRSEFRVEPRFSDGHRRARGPPDGARTAERSAETGWARSR